MFKTDILFTGYYGHQNTGDDAFVEVAVWGARKFWKKNENRFLARTSLLPKTILPSKGYPFEIKKTYGLQSKILLNKTDAFVYAGGSTIHSELTKNHIRWNAFQRKKSGAKMKFGGIGVSIGPFKSIKDEKAVVSYLKQMDFLAVRDQTSFDFVSNIDDLPYTPINSFDLAALLPEIYTHQQGEVSTSKRTIGISVCRYESLQKHLSNEHEDLRNSMLINLIKHLDEKEDIHFKFFIINGHFRVGDDLLTYETIRQSQPKSFEVVPYNRETRYIWESIAKCDFVISTRLHAAIFACFANTPFMLNEYHRKCEDFLLNVGYNEEYRLYNSDYDVEKISNHILSIINDKNLYVKPSQIEKMKSAAALNFSLVKL